MVPECSETPPIIDGRSITATRLRAFAAAMAPFCPAGPLPITTRSYADALTLRASNPQCQEHWFSALAGTNSLLFSLLHCPGLGSNPSASMLYSNPNGPRP